MSQLKDKLKVDFKQKVIHGNLTVYDFLDNGHHIAYLASLELTGYGDSREEAHELLMRHVLRDYFEGLFTSLTEPQITKELKKLGWVKSKFFNKDFNQTAYVDKEGVLQAFNLPAETKIESQVLEVA